MNPELAMAILKWAAPIILEILRSHRQRFGVSAEDLTDEQVIAEFNQNLDKYLNEGAAWRAQHPDA